MSQRGSLGLAALCLTVAGLFGAEAGKVVVPFDGSDLKGWKFKGGAETRSKWTVGVASLDDKAPNKLAASTPAKPGEGELINLAASVDLYTDEVFGDCLVELEVMVPKGSNSGIYLMGEYEVQVFDSFGKDKVGPGDMGGIYNTAAPKVNACKKPGEWQKFVIDFRAPRFDGDKKTANAKFVKVTLNGEVIHEDVEVKGPTGGQLKDKESATGPLLFQGDHGPVAFRNIKITPR
jgi:hypothetical protein